MFYILTSLHYRKSYEQIMLWDSKMHKCEMSECCIEIRSPPIKNIENKLNKQYSNEIKHCGF